MGVVLVHGGGFAASCWELVLPLLETPAIAVDLPGRGSRPGDLAEITVDDFAAAVVADIEATGWDQVVLVGHSLAGITLPRVADLVPERLAHMVFVACTVPAQGRSTLEALDGDLRDRAQARVAGGADQQVDRHSTVGLLANDLDEGQVDYMLGRMVPEAPAAITAPSDLSGLAHPIGRTWVRCLRDAIVPVAVQDRYIIELGGAAGVDVVDLDAGHMAMIGRPGELAGIVDGVAARTLT